MIGCPSCDNYNRGQGSTACKKCPKYRDIQLKSGRRKTIKIDVLPDALLEQIADIPSGPDGDDIMGELRSMPAELSAVISMRYFSGLTAREIADIMSISTRTAERKIAVALAALRLKVVG
jgi:DNA-directed RNA polymerase specialized sigma24 family protein